MNDLESVAGQLGDIVMQKEALEEKIYQVTLTIQILCENWHEHMRIL